MFQKITICKNTIREFENSSKLEWLETNGIGGYSSSTVSGANTRRYHGLLVANIKEQLERKVLLSKLEEKVFVAGKEYELACNQYPGVIHPSGYKFIDSFCLNPFPTYTFSTDDFVLEKQIFIVHEMNRTVISYRLISAKSEVKLEIKPMVCERNFHHLQKEDKDFNSSVHKVEDGVMMKPYNENIYLIAKKAIFKKDGYWYKNFEYAQEMLRGLDFQEDLFSPGYFEVKLNQSDEFSIIASTDYPENFDYKAARKEEIKRRERIIQNPLISDKVEKLEKLFSKIFIRSLLLAADSFLIKKASDRSVVSIARF